MEQAGVWVASTQDTAQVSEGVAPACSGGLRAGWVLHYTMHINHLNSGTATQLGWAGWGCSPALAMER